MTWITALYLVLSAASVLSEKINGRRFHNVLADDIVRPVLGTQTLQDHFDSASFVIQPINGSDVITQLAGTLETNLGEAFEAVTRIRDAALSEHSLWEISSTEVCCDLTSSLEYDYSFKNYIGTEVACSRVSGEAPLNATVPYSPRLLDAFKQNRANAKFIKWQYVGTPYGTLIQYPTQSSSDCDGYDNRFRPWYVEAATPQPKDVVLVMDRSDSMRRSGAIASAKNAAVTLINTLNPNDRIGVVVFSDDSYTPVIPEAGCISSQLAFATSSTKDILNNFITEIQPYGQTNYLKAFTKAFDLLSKTPTPQNDMRERVLAIVFFTDGEPTDLELSASYDKMYNLTASRNAVLQNKVVILTYGFGEGIKETGQELLRNISLQPVYDHRFDPPSPGQFTLISRSSELRIKLATYYNYFHSTSNLSAPIITVPYYDFFGLGLVSSVCLSVNTKDDLHGVTCIDVRIADVLGDTAYFETGSHAYTFVIDATGRVLMHPNLPNLYSIKHSPSYINIRDLEPEDAMRTVIDKMKSGTSGSKTLEKIFIHNRGTAKREGISLDNRLAEVHWQRVSDTSLSVAIVFAVSDRRVKIDTSPASNFFYHRLDLINTDKTCNHNGKLSLIEGSAVKFSGEAFKSPYKYYNTEEDALKVNEYTLHMKSQDESSIFKEGVKEMVSLTAVMDEFWKERTRTFALSSYVASFNGMIRLYPGVALDALYDPKERSWFKRANANRGKYTFAVPYIDAFGQGLITTLSQTVYAGSISGTHSADDLVSAVLGIDMGLPYIGYLLNSTFPECMEDDFRCFLVDTSGYLIFDADFIIGESLHQLDFLHIMEKKPDIATRLIELGHMKSTTCTDFYNKKEYKTWRLNVEEGYVTHLDTFPYFEIQYVQSSNVYVGIHTYRPNSVAVCTCPIRSGSQRTTFPKCRLQDGCECPCTTDAMFDQCKNTFITESEIKYACKEEAGSANFSNPVENEKQLLSDKPTCYNYQCASQLHPGDCVSLRGCSWCEDDTSIYKCLEGACPSDPTDPGNPDSNKSIYIGVGCGVGIGLALAATAIAAGIIYNKRRKVKKERNEEPIYLEPRDSTIPRDKVDSLYSSIEDGYLSLKKDRNKPTTERGSSTNSYVTAKQIEKSPSSESEH